MSENAKSGGSDVFMSRKEPEGRPFSPSCSCLPSLVRSVRRRVSAALCCALSHALVAVHEQWMIFLKIWC